VQSAKKYSSGAERNQSVAICAIHSLWLSMCATGADLSKEFSSFFGLFFFKAIIVKSPA
jgi:hypothetical protein